MTIIYKDVYGNAPVAIEKADEIHSYDVTLNGTYTLPNEECIEVFIQGDDTFSFGSQDLQNIIVASGSTLILDISNTNIITLNGNTIIHVTVLK